MRSDRLAQFINGLHMQCPYCGKRYSPIKFQVDRCRRLSAGRSAIPSRHVCRDNALHANIQRTLRTPPNLSKRLKNFFPTLSTVENRGTKVTWGKNTTYYYFD